MVLPERKHQFKYLICIQNPFHQRLGTHNSLLTHLRNKADVSGVLEKSLSFPGPHSQSHNWLRVLDVKLSLSQGNAWSNSVETEVPPPAALCWLWGLRFLSVSRIGPWCVRGGLGAGLQVELGSSCFLPSASPSPSAAALGSLSNRFLSPPAKTRDSQ